MISTFQITNIFWTNFTVLLLTTSLVGGIMTVVWLVLGKILEKTGFLNIVYDLLKMTVFFYCVPLVYGILKVFEFELGRGYLFDTTKTILIFSKVFCAIWIFGAVVIMAYVLNTARQLKRKYKEAFTCDMQTQKLFQSILRDLKLEQSRVKIDIKQSYHVKIPCIVGIIHPVIILPVKTYTEEELQYILMHEIIHYKQKDILLKWISIVLCACHFYNPFTWLLLIQIQKWSEFTCDYKVCQYTRTVSKYFEVLINAATDEGIKARLASHFVEHKHELVERAKKMKNVYGRKKRSKICVVIVLGIAFVLSSITVSAVTVGSAERYIGGLSDHCGGGEPGARRPDDGDSLPRGRHDGRRGGCRRGLHADERAESGARRGIAGPCGQRAGQVCARDPSGPGTGNRADPAGRANLRRRDQRRALHPDRCRAPEILCQ